MGTYMGNLVSDCIKNIMGIQRNPRDQNCDPEDFQDDEDQEREARLVVLRRENAALMVESAQVDEELAASKRETDRLRDILREREKEVQALRGKVAAQRARRAAREAKEAKVADEAKKVSESPEEKI